MEAEDTVPLRGAGLGGTTNGSQPESRTSPWRNRAIAVGVIVTVAVMLAGGYAARRFLLKILSAARFGYRVATLSVYRRCPDCASLIRREARVCRHCGLELATRR